METDNLKQLRYFKFKHAHGGFAQDGDELYVAFKYENKADLIAKFDQMGIPLNALPPDKPQPVSGKNYKATELVEFKSGLAQFKDLEQPGHSMPFGHRVFIWVYDGNFNISVAGTGTQNPYQVNDADYEVCGKLEIEFDRLGWFGILV